MERRAFLTDSLGAAAGVVSLPSAASRPEPTGAVGTSDLFELRQQLHSLYQLDDAFGGDEVRSLAQRHLRRIRRVINTTTYPDTIGRQLQLLAGETAEQCGWLAYDADDQDAARRYWGEALATATMLRDAGLEILVLASMAMQANHEGRPRDGLDLSHAAQERAQKYGSPTLQSLIAAREARALSLLNDKAAATKKLTDAMRLAERIDRGRPSPTWAAFHGPAELDYAQGTFYSEIGHHSAASTFLRAALSHQDRTYGRNRALYRITLSRSLIQAGEVDEGAAVAVESLQHLDEVESGRVMRGLREVAGQLGNVSAVSARSACAELTEYVHAKGAA
ncbi:hypothetical protein [Streptomyces smyrnaeus]|uniref:hypothetical protein n=1 Tax=Streptomyces smyrnaeus TaxID=1387713 RepID=UPI0036B1FBFF